MARSATPLPFIASQPPPHPRRSTQSSGDPAVLLVRKIQVAAPRACSRDSMLRRHGCRREIDASASAPDFHENLGLIHLPEVHAIAGPLLEVLGDRYVLALTSRLRDTEEVRESRRPMN